MLDLIDIIEDSYDTFKKHGIKGCLLVIGVLVLIFGGIIALVYLGGGFG